MKEYYPNLKVEEGGFLHNRNIVIGDVEKSKVIIGAHYDTCALLPVPNFITPQNIFIYLLYNLFLVLVICMPAALCYFLISYLTGDGVLAYYISYSLFFITLIFGLLIGIPSKHTANDNTSGVVTICELLSRLTEEEKDNVTFVLFDNEENGLFGSMFFAKKHKSVLKDKLFINLDCVSDGDHLLVIPNKVANKKYSDIFTEVFKDTDKKKVTFAKGNDTFYPSDQVNFPNSLALSFFNKNRFGLYMNKIHTNKDVVFDVDNIEYLCEKISSLIKMI